MESHSRLSCRQLIRSLADISSGVIKCCQIQETVWPFLCLEIKFFRNRNFLLKFHPVNYAYFQTGGECLRTYISIAPEQVFNHQDSEGHTGLWYSLQVAALLLNPSSSEYTATFVGRLIITLITKAGNILGENLDLLLKAVLSKMQRAETLSVIQVSTKCIA